MCVHFHLQFKFTYIGNFDAIRLEHMFVLFCMNVYPVYVCVCASFCIWLLFDNVWDVWDVGDVQGWFEHQSKLNESSFRIILNHSSFYIQHHYSTSTSSHPKFLLEYRMIRNGDLLSLNRCPTKLALVLYLFIF